MRPTLSRLRKPRSSPNPRLLRTGIAPRRTQRGPTCSGSRSSRPFSFFRLITDQTPPAVVLANAGRGDWILCQVTSKPYADGAAVILAGTDFQQGSLNITSYARPGKLFTAIAGLVETEVGVLQPAGIE